MVLSVGLRGYVRQYFLLLRLSSLRDVLRWQTLILEGTNEMTYPWVTKPNIHAIYLE